MILYTNVYKSMKKYVKLGGVGPVDNRPLRRRRKMFKNKPAAQAAGPEPSQ